MTFRSLTGAFLIAFSTFTGSYLASDTSSEPLVTLNSENIIQLSEMPDTIALDDAEVLCMQQNMYYEARNQKSDEAYTAVGYTVLNRVAHKRWPDSICGVVKQKALVKRTGRVVCQFSWYCDGKSDVPNLANKQEREAWERAGELAREVILGEVDNPIGNATMYHATYVSPNWNFKKLAKVAKIETHIFYLTKA